ncbi:uncharacterized protein YALI1_B01011g [Yarrowia lipolytica]|uniref:Uncharacterized protein n=1 Tax=Yarrowia lipolytica TaxID=4952 RepID=A0A1D8N5V6_YARLL|nr:hypothetical protein YALI1_B01011g [Yarrowia lipolytica]
MTGLSLEITPRSFRATSGSARVFQARYVRWMLQTHYNWQTQTESIGMVGFSIAMSYHHKSSSFFRTLLHWLQ